MFYVRYAPKILSVREWSARKESVAVVNNSGGHQAGGSRGSGCRRVRKTGGEQIISYSLLTSYLWRGQSSDRVPCKTSEKLPMPENTMATIFKILMIGAESPLFIVNSDDYQTEVHRDGQIKM